MGYRFVDHTADVAADVTGATLDELFASAAAALTDVITDRGEVRASGHIPVALSAASVEDLLVDWLNELLYVFEVRRFLTADADVHVTADAPPRLEAIARGEPQDAARHPIRVLVKGATYHALRIQHADEGWQARIVFDV